MRRYWRIGLAWLGATALSVLIASTAVAGIRDRVVETPVAIGPPTTTTTTVAPGEVATTSSPIDPIATATSPTTTSTTTTTTAPPTATTIVESTVTTTAPPASTTTTTAPPQTTTTLALSNETYDMIGGTVILSFGGGEVHLVSAAPRPGFSADYEHTGPVEVEIKFESNDHKSKLEAKFESGDTNRQVILSSWANWWGTWKG
ncbi:MAG: hypothetical protein QNL12_11270, partial [Acidimicrobiia bacterium]|nr:hypothetical protein [Acidimicrobiia bacterium]MDX2467885.1 hypothetical protein [Acidimicrobiia bacterium]